MQNEVMDAAFLIKQGLDRIAEELRLTRESNERLLEPAQKINEMNLKHLEAVMGGGIVGAVVVPGGNPGPRKLT